jgi:quinol monooxygenase YgiN
MFKYYLLHGSFEPLPSIETVQFRGEPGVVTYQLSQVQSDNTRFVTYEVFL